MLYIWMYNKNGKKFNINLENLFIDKILIHSTFKCNKSILFLLHFIFIFIFFENKEKYMLHNHLINV
jgi:hypothetical protein